MNKNEIEFLKNWADKHCPSLEEVEYMHQADVKAALMVDEIYTDENVRVRLPYTVRQTEFLDTRSFAYVMFALGKRYLGSELEVIYAKPQDAEGRVVVQFTVQIKPKKKEK